MEDCLFSWVGVKGNIPHGGIEEGTAPYIKQYSYLIDIMITAVENLVSIPTMIVWNSPFNIFIYLDN